MSEVSIKQPEKSMEWTIEDIKKRRRIYLSILLLMFAGNILGIVIGGGIGSFAVNFFLGVIFLILFNNVANQVLDYSGGKLIVISFVILFIPFVSLLTIVIVDREIYDALKEKEELLGKIKPQLSSMAVFSLVLCLLLPFIGFPMAIDAVRKISKSEGRLYGKTLAWISIIVNGLILALIIIAITLALLGY